MPNSRIDLITYYLTIFIKFECYFIIAGTGRLGHAARRKTMKEMVFSPSTSTPFKMGQGFVAGASLVGLGGLVFYGLGFSNEIGAAEKAMIWPVSWKYPILILKNNSFI